MMEKLIELESYTPEILQSILNIKTRMTITSVCFTEDEIKVFEVGDTIYILANPILGEETIIDENDNPIRVPMRNLTVIYDKDWIQSSVEGDKLVFRTKIPRLRVLRPDLCERILVK